MAEKSAKSHVEVSDVDEQSGIVTRERNLPRYLSDYTEVLGQNKPQTIKNRRKSMQANLTGKMNIIKEYLIERKDCKLINLACTQLNRVWEQLIENHKEFQALCKEDEDLQEADTALAEELNCGTVYYGEVELHSGEMVSKATKVRTEGTENSSITSFGRPSKKSSSKTTSSVSRGCARAAAGKADLSKLKVKQLKEKAQLEAKIAAQELQLEAELAIQEAEHEASRREIEALLLKEHLDEFNLSDRMKDFEDNPVDFSQSALSTSAMISSLPKRHLPVFDNDPCAWPNWYGMFKALVDDQQLSKTQKMIYVKVSIKGTAEKAVAGMFFDGTMYDKAIAELTERFGNPTLISKSLINLFLEIPAVLDENTSSLRLCVDNLHNIAGTLKTYGHEADLRAAANMQQIITKLSPKVALRWSWKQMFKSKRCLLYQRES
ncbi:hypothetical protein P5673_029210 [Acropora cervicornis]|uniref:Uncharacterized protein n=1 Tax=Acropora cervicornis TaxID=6130 RepID=A0AAD9UUK0_ACRCE|nr:hypothetical protein P5673_029210 [Acropora cervicornis]